MSRRLTEQELIQVLQIALTTLGRAQLVNLKLLEPVVLEKLPRLAPQTVVDVVEAYSKHRCGSRPFWQAVLGSVTSNSNFAVTSVVRLVHSVNESPVFYRPTFLLSELWPQVFLCENLSLSDSAVIISAYCKWPKSVGSRGELYRMVNSIVGRNSEFDNGRLEDIGSILSSISKLRMYTPEVEKFCQFVERNTGKCTAKILSAMYKISVYSGRPLSRDFSVFSLVSLTGEQMSPSSLVSCCVVFGRLFGLLNTYEYNAINFGPSTEKYYLFWESAEKQLITQMRASQINIRAIARLFEIQALVRVGSDAFWTSMIAVLERHVDLFSELSPEELVGVSFGVWELNIPVPPLVSKGLVFSIFEKINLFTPIMINKVLPFVYEFGDIGTLCEFVDGETSADVLAQMVFSMIGVEEGKVDAIFREYIQNCQSVISPEVFGDIESVLKQKDYCVESRVFVAPNLMVDFVCKSGHEEIWVIVSSPLHTRHGSNNTYHPTGTAIFRHSMVKKFAKKSVPIVNIAAEEWVNCSVEERIGLLHSEDAHTDDGAHTHTEFGPHTEFKHTESTHRDVSPHTEFTHTESTHRDVSPHTGSTHIESTHRDVSPHTESLQRDISRFVRKDRNAAHRKRAPPNTELPWVPTVLTLKRRPRRRLPRS